MAKKENVLNQYRDQALEKISADIKEYHKFLEYCGRGNIHKLSFNSQLALFWQKPFATVIAGFDAWNKGAGNRILYGSHGAGIYEEPGMSFKGSLQKAQEMCRGSHLSLCRLSRRRLQSLGNILMQSGVSLVF